MRTLRTIGIVGSATALLFSASVTFAREDFSNIRQGINDSRKTPAGISRPMTATTTATTTRMEIKKEAHDRIEVIREEAHERMRAVREEARMRIAAQRGKAEQRLTDIRDKAKQQTAQNLAKQFENLNKTWTDHFMQLLDRYEVVLGKIQERKNIAASAGKDVTIATVAIESAKTAIASARIAVTTQAAKTYVLDASSIVTTTSTTTPSGQEELVRGLRTSFKNLHKTMFKDLFALRDGPMKDARKSVHDALQALGKIIRVDEGNATSTTATSNQ